MTILRTDELENATLVEVSLRGARLTDCDLSGALLRATEVHDLDIDAPWLFETGGYLRVNGVDVVPLVRAELERRFPGRSLMLAPDPAELRAAWAAVEAAWAGVLERVESLPEGSADVSVDGEWSFAETLRHLVLATDIWLRRVVREVEQPYHPVGLAYTGAEDPNLPPPAPTPPSYDEVLAVRADRVAQVRDYLAGVTSEELARERTNPWSATRPKTTLTCLHTILHEEWEHLRFAVRDLDTITAGRS